MEIAQDFMDGKAAGRLIKMAVINDVHFTGEEIVDMLLCVDIDAINRVLETVVIPLTENQIYTLDGYVDTDSLPLVARKSGISMEETEEFIDDLAVETPKERRKRHRQKFFEGAAQTMMIDLLIDGLFGKKK